MQHVTPEYVLIIVSAAEACLQQSVMRTMCCMVLFAQDMLEISEHCFSCFIHN